MKKKLIIASAIITIIAFAAFTLMGPIMSRVEQPKYDVTHSNKNIEHRAYSPMIVAQTQVTGSRQEAITSGFKILADYIFGNNSTAAKIDMTAPVQQSASKKIAMTAPVKQSKIDDKWNIQFVMPSEYTLETLPKPNNSKVEIISIPAKHYAAIRFSGRHTDTALETYTNKLKSYLEEQNITTVSSPIYNFYNPPWTLPLLRRNEVMFEINQD